MLNVPPFDIGFERFEVLAQPLVLFPRVRVIGVEPFVV
jgi:hypothetical protein